MNARAFRRLPAPLIGDLLAAGGVLIASVTASSLDTLFARGDSSIAVSWTPDSINTRSDWYVTYGSGCTGADSIYRHCDFLPGQTYRSIAYSYGGEDGYVLFSEKIVEGFLAGSHMCHYTNFGDPGGVVAGSDCSGFICYLWEVPRVSTRELYSQYAVINRSELDVGDILVKPGSHAVLIIEKEDDNNFLIWESTSVVNGCRERMIDIGDAYWDTYYPRRYPGLNSGTTTVNRSHYPHDLPNVSVCGTRIFIESPTRWNGTVTLFSLQGKLLFSSPNTIDSEKPAVIDIQKAAGTCIIRLNSSDGISFTIPIGAVP